MATSEAQTLFHKLCQRHLVDPTNDGEALLYIDRHLVYEVTSPQAFEGLRLAGRKPWRRETVIATVDHNVPTTAAERTGIDAIADPLSRAQVRASSTPTRASSASLSSASATVGRASSTSSAPSRARRCPA